MNLISILIFGVSLGLNAIIPKADEAESDEFTLRNQLFADVFLCRKGVDRLQISVEVLNKINDNQMEILKDIQSQLAINDSQEKGNICHSTTGMFNSTFKKFNNLESRLVTKLEELQDDQTTRFNEIIVQQKLNKNCGFQGASSTTFSLLSTMLSEVSEKLDKFEEKFLKLDSVEQKLNLKQNKFEKFVEDQLKILQEINSKLSKNHEQFENINKELKNLKDLKMNVNRVITNPRPKLPMEVILGLTSSNITTLK